jgi:acyl carrier protein
VRSGGRIFVGDVRSLPLLTAFHTSVQLHRSPGWLPIAELQNQIHRRVAAEEELVIDPEFFFALQRHLPRITHVEIAHKRGSFHNELTRFRYDVMLHIDQCFDGISSETRLDWRADRLDLSRLAQIVRGGNARTLRITQVPNARIARELKGLELLRDPGGLETVSDLRHALKSAQDGAVDPTDIWALQNSTSYSVQLYWPGPGADDSFDAVFHRTSAPSTDILDGARTFSVQIDAARPWSAYANRPLERLQEQGLVPALRRFLQTKLPDYMVPAIFVMLDALPLTPNGKLDRRALPAPDASRPTRQDPYVAPRTRTEELVARIWSQLLGVERVGAQDNFFELGGHSLLATRVLSRVREAFHVKINLRVIFEAPTVAGLAQLVNDAQARGELDDEPAITRLPRDLHTATLLPGGLVNASALARGRRNESGRSTGTSNTPGEAAQGDE